MADRELSAKKTENEILDFLKEQGKEISFYKLYRSLNYTSGKAQSALKRLNHKNKVVIKKKIDKFKTFVWYKDFELEPDVIENEDEDLMIFPVRLDRKIGAILREVPEISSEHSNFIDLVKEALIFFFQRKITPDQKRKAIKSAIEKGKISEKLAKEILGE
ncbi:MAG: hypothetical protein ACOC44_02290 [Promethearchaeia archaeon]